VQDSANRLVSLRHITTAMTPVGQPRNVGRRTLLTVLPVAVLAAAPHRAMAADNPGTRQQLDGLVIYFAVIPAGFVLGHSAEYTGREMDGSTPEGRYVHHLLVALFDSTTGVRIANASVTAVVQGGHQRSEDYVELGPMTIGGAQAYGGLATLRPRDRYRIEIDVVRPGTPAVRAIFYHQHLQP
jgi:hypothetical protein